MLALDPFGYRWATAALAQLQQAFPPPALTDFSPGAVVHRITLQELEQCAAHEAHYREVFGTPTSLAAVVQEQHALKDAGLPWVRPAMLTTAASSAHVMALSAAAFPVFCGATPAAVLQDMASRQDTVMAQLRSAKTDEAAAERRREAAASAQASPSAGHLAPPVLSPEQLPPAPACPSLTVSSAGPESLPTPAGPLSGDVQPRRPEPGPPGPPTPSLDVPETPPTHSATADEAAPRDASSTGVPGSASSATPKRSAPPLDSVDADVPCSPAKQRKGPARAAKAAPGTNKAPAAAPPRAARSRAPPGASDEAPLPSS